MRRHWGILAGLLVGLAMLIEFVAPGRNDVAAQPAIKPAPPKPVEANDEADEQAIRASAAEFVKAYNSHDAKAAAALFALKAEVIDETGHLVKGREAIEADFAAMFKQFPQASTKIDVDSVRILTPNIAVEEGTMRAAPVPKGPENVSGYVAVHVKVDGKWLVGSVRDFEAPAELTPHDRLQDLAWLVGEWINENTDASVHTTCRWADNGNFLLQEFDVRMAGGIALSGNTRIGWNGQLGQFQSWVFDTEGGHNVGTWTNRGDEWVVKSHGVTPQGEAASATNVYRFINKDTLTWRSYDRTIGGEPVDDIPEFIIKRRAPAPKD